jgi:uncharacterized protein (TIGR03435 family)
MRKFLTTHRPNPRAKIFLSVIALLAISSPFAFVAAHATPSRARLSVQSTSVEAPTLEYEIVLIKLNKSGSEKSRPVMNNTPDGYIATNVPLMLFIQGAYGIFDTERIIGAPDWLNSDRYDIEAKMDSSVAAALSKLSPEQRTVARQQMFQALLADRFKLSIHRDTKDLLVYSLVIAKSGSKLHDAKPGDTYPNGYKDGSGRGGAGTIQMNGRGQLVGQGVSTTQFAGMLSFLLSHPIQDKTGLAGKYDFTLQWTPGEGEGAPILNRPVVTPTGEPPPALDPNGPSMEAALQDQLGLKLESKKGPVEIIVIDHVERPSRN